LLGQIGLDGARVRMFNLSSAEGPQFAQYCAEFSRHIAELGPNPLSENAQVKQTSRTEPGD
jgi:F420-non-reducing hydrogenase iron-sulfur subunit